MPKSPEQLTNFEILSVAEADDYIRAANLILSQDAAEIPGLNHPCRRKAKGGVEPFDFSYVEVRNDATSEDELVRFESAAFMNGRRNEVSIGQFVGTEKTHDKQEKSHDKQVTRSFKPGSQIPIYKVGQWEGNGKSVLRVATGEGAVMAEDLFVTMATDFKMMLEEKLAGRPDLQDAIEWYAANMPDPAKMSRGRLLGGRILRRS